MRDDPILLRQLAGEMKVYTTGTVKLESRDKDKNPVLLELVDTMYIPQARVNLFSTQKMRKANIRVDSPFKIGRAWIQNEEGEYLGNISENAVGRGVVDCKTLLPPFSSSPLRSPSLSKMLPAEVAVEEAMVDAVDMELLHRRMGHLGSANLMRLQKEGVMRGLEGGFVGEMGPCQGCELGRPRAHPHPTVDVTWREGHEAVGVSAC